MWRSSSRPVGSPTRGRAVTESASRSRGAGVDGAACDREKTVCRAIGRVLPGRLAACLLAELGLTETGSAVLAKSDRYRLVQALTAYSLSWGRAGGFERGRSHRRRRASVRGEPTNAVRPEGRRVLFLRRDPRRLRPDRRDELPVGVCRRKGRRRLGSGRLIGPCQGSPRGFEQDLGEWSRPWGLSRLHVSESSIAPTEAPFG